MSFTISKNVEVVKTYPEFQLRNGSGYETKTITYTAEAISALTGSNCSVIFRVNLDGVEDIGTAVHDFIYSGEGSPLVEAEVSFKKELLNE